MPFIIRNRVGGFVGGAFDAKLAAYQPRLDLTFIEASDPFVNIGNGA